MREHMLLHMPNTDSSMHLLPSAQWLRNVCTILFFLIVSHSTVHFKIVISWKIQELRYISTNSFPSAKWEILFITRYPDKVEWSDIQMIMFYYITKGLGKPLASSSTFPTLHTAQRAPLLHSVTGAKSSPLNPSALQSLSYDFWLSLPDLSLYIPVKPSFSCSLTSALNLNIICR